MGFLYAMVRRLFCLGIPGTVLPATPTTNSNSRDFWNYIVKLCWRILDKKREKRLNGMKVLHQGQGKRLHPIMAIDDEAHQSPLV